MDDFYHHKRDSRDLVLKNLQYDDCLMYVGVIKECVEYLQNT